MPINEFTYHLYQNDHSHETKTQCFYWLLWLFTLDKKRKKKKKKEICCAIRPNKLIDPKFYTHYICIIWDIMLQHPDIQDRTCTLYKIIKSLYNIYFIDFKIGSLSQKKYILFTALSFLLNTNPQINYSQNDSPIPNQYYKFILQSQLHVNDIYIKVHQNAVKLLEEKKLFKQKRIRHKHNAQVFSQREHAHFDEFMKNEMYLYQSTI